jgi:hypothetical protein
VTNKLLAAYFNGAHSDYRNQRLTNQAFQTVLKLAGDEELRPSPAEPFATILNEFARGNEAECGDATR